MTTTPTHFLTLTPDPSDLDTQLRTLCETYGIGAIGASLTRQYGQTKVIAAALGQIDPAVPPSQAHVPSRTETNC